MEEIYHYIDRTTPVKYLLDKKIKGVYPLDLNLHKEKGLEEIRLRNLSCPLNL